MYKVKKGTESQSSFHLPNILVVYNKFHFSIFCFLFCLLPEREEKDEKATSYTSHSEKKKEPIDVNLLQKNNL